LNAVQTRRVIAAAAGISRHLAAESKRAGRVMSSAAAVVSRQWEARGKRGRIVIAGTAAVLTLGTTASAAAAAWPAGAAGGKIGAAHAQLVSNQQNVIAFQQARSGVNRRTAQMQAIEAQRAAAARKAAAAARAAAAAAAKKAAARKAAEVAAAQAAATKAAAKAAAQAAAKKTAAVAASGTPQQIAEAMLGSYGWSTSQFSCLNSLWTRESNWDVTASNASSGAYGIPQALPGAKMASAGSDWASSAATQIKWGLTYIQGIYGSPCGAWSHEESSGWY
jgi:hypothetical protein